MRYLFILFLSLASAISSLACTSAIISGKMTRDGRPLLWKNRDTSHLINYVARTEATDSPHAYVALYNSEDTDAREAWIGYNDAGFAIMNTASYNLHHPSDSWKDREGFIMSEALANCVTVNDFRNLLQTLPQPLGVEANFGVIDAEGNGGFFETDDEKFTFYPLDDDNPVIVRTNFSVSGGEGGLGQVRYVNACTLLAPHIAKGDISPELLTDGLSRSFYYSPDCTDKSTASTVVDKDFIPRHSTSASIAIEGANSRDDVDKMVMWTLMGYPPCGVTLPVTIDVIPASLLQDSEGGCKASREANALMDKVFYKRKGSWRIKMPQLKRISDENRSKSLGNYQLYREFHK
ncbi:MAG: hypothetical protein HDS52_06305 [Barnesiella sp.]|nr:hypothetical protein [Barnesiella sp.]